jgi:hypothetical protein
MSCCGSKKDVPQGQVTKSNTKHNTVMAKKFFGAD